MPIRRGSRLVSVALRFTSPCTDLPSFNHARVPDRTPPHFDRVRGTASIVPGQRRGHLRGRGRESAPPALPQTRPMRCEKERHILLGAFVALSPWLGRSAPSPKDR